jgi:hypothetical protein
VFNRALLHVAIIALCGSCHPAANPLSESCSDFSSAFSENGQPTLKVFADGSGLWQENISPVPGDDGPIGGFGRIFVDDSAFCFHNDIGSCAFAGIIGCQLSVFYGDQPIKAICEQRAVPTSKAQFVVVHVPIDEGDDSEPVPKLRILAFDDSGTLVSIRVMAASGERTQIWDEKSDAISLSNLHCLANAAENVRRSNFSE